MTESSEIVLNVERREDFGKRMTKRLRAEGKIPAVVCGGGKKTVAVQVEEKAIEEILKQKSGENTIFVLNLKGTKERRRAMIHEIHRDPMSNRFLHIDFLRIVRGHKITVEIPIELEGESAGVEEGGILEFVRRTVDIEVLPREVPEQITLDISNLGLNENLTLADLEDFLPKSARLLDDPSRVVVTITAPAMPEEEEEEELEAALIEEEPEEPEVIGKGKSEESEDEEQTG